MFFSLKQRYTIAVPFMAVTQGAAFRLAVGRLLIIAFPVVAVTQGAALCFAVGRLLVIAVSLMAVA